MQYGKQELKIDQLALMGVLVEEINRQHGGKLCADVALMNGAIHIGMKTAELFDGIEVDCIISREETTEEKAA